MTRYPCWVAFYHYVRPGAAGAGIRGLTPERFRAQLDALQGAADIIGYDAFADALDARQDFDRPAVLLTFDDGLIDHRDIVWPELRARGLTGVFFANGAPLAAPLPQARSGKTLNVHRVHLLLDALGADRLRRELGDAVRAADLGFEAAPDLYRYDGDAEQVLKRLLNYELPYAIVDTALDALAARHLGDDAHVAERLYLTAADMTRMAAEGATFGYHTATHRVLSRLAPDAQRAELADGVSLVRALTGQARVPFCYPYGHRQTYDDATLALLAELGYDMAFTTARAPAFPAAASRFEVPRYDTRDLVPEGTIAPVAAAETHP